ncbi:MAG: type III-B CRISPR module RAMP protein Cmr1, partial [Chloroflexota bacterium]
MPYLRFPLRTVSPLINKGTSKIAELRTPSVIGQLRFWLRAILGAQLADSEAVYQQESMLLGSTSTASSVMMQLREHAIIEESVRVLPHSSDRRKSFEEESIFDNSSFDLKLIFRPGTTLDPRLAQALSLWLLLGGLGKRSRRMFGSIQLQSYPRPSKTFDQTDTNYPDWWANWEQIEKRPHLYARLVQLSLEIAFAE